METQRRKFSEQLVAAAIAWTSVPRSLPQELTGRCLEHGPSPSFPEPPLTRAGPSSKRHGPGRQRHRADEDWSALREPATHLEALQKGRRRDRKHPRRAGLQHCARAAAAAEGARPRKGRAPATCPAQPGRRRGTAPASPAAAPEVAGSLQSDGVRCVGLLGSRPPRRRYRRIPAAPTWLPEGKCLYASVPALRPPQPQRERRSCLRCGGLSLPLRLSLAQASARPGTPSP
mmetsp:Transcript_15008/g.31231  ORF Transcript_15008/g.31231 Transcript_15008/m.31231 type:complete len:231 (-) Transcript_15008:238-930(-)